MWRLVVAALLVGGCSESTGPRLDAVDPAAAPRGGIATITGQRLCGPSGDCAKAAGQVQIGIDSPVVQAVVVSLADTSMTIAIPTVTPIGPTSLVATIDNRSSNALAFEVLP